MCATAYMLDTNAFDRLTEGLLPLEAIDGRQVFVTHVQRDELNRTKDPELRARLLRTFAQVDATSLPTSTSIFDDTNWDEGCWSAEDGMYERLLGRIAELDAATGKKVRDPLNHSRDARIAETAIKAGLVLVTDDANLSHATREAGGEAISSAAFSKRQASSSALEKPLATATDDPL